jgi:hypothetical protein
MTDSETELQAVVLKPDAEYRAPDGADPIGPVENLKCYFLVLCASASSLIFSSSRLST